jgi:hypothetical protein
MELAGAVIHSGTEMLLVQSGWVHGFHQDRRGPWAETRVGDAARRRKPPPEVMALVGSGKLWVAKGEFEILERDARRHQKGHTMRLEVRGMMLYVSHLKASTLRGSDTQRWSFAALFEPTREQLGWVQGQAPTTPVVSTTPRPNHQGDRDSLLDFLRELAYPEDENEQIKR